ncbi:MAG: helix-turn-helix transcriptional regulator, partial [Halioglobus sp.]
LIYLVLSELPGDFLEKRRQFRIWFVCILIFVPTAATIERVFISETLYLDSNSILESVSIFLLSCLLLIHIARPKETYIFEKKGAVGSENSTPELSDQHLAELIPADRHSLEILEAKMRDGLYREPGLTISRIAKTVNVPEHRLRKIINHHLGYRNISQYLNSYRIEESKNRLADADERHIPILTIAMEAGYMSLRPFNRAFKNLTSQTPTEYRALQLSSRVPSPSKHDPSKDE